jgi:hypothetical protein
MASVSALDHDPARVVHAIIDRSGDHAADVSAT